jgi:hypothetical protein
MGEGMGVSSFFFGCLEVSEGAKVKYVKKKKCGYSTFTTLFG